MAGLAYTQVHAMTGTKVKFRLVATYHQSGGNH